MSHHAAKEQESVDTATEQQEPALKLVESPVAPETPPLEHAEQSSLPKTPVLDQVEDSINRLTLDYMKSGYAKYERGSLLRIFRKQFRRYVKYLMDAKGSDLSVDEACKRASAKYDQKGALELMEQMLNRDFESVSFSELSHLWGCSPEDAESYFGLLKQEAQREFCSGHFIAQVFEPGDWFRSVWRRAQFLAIRDTFISESEPEGGIEFALIDTLALSFFMQDYWAKACVTRTKENPVRESVEYQAWKHYVDEEAKQRKYDPGYWKLPFVSEDRAIHTATEMLDQFSRLFQRTLRQLNNHRLAKLKTEKLKAEIRRLNGNSGCDTDS